MPAKLGLKALARKALETPGELTDEERRRLYAAALAKLKKPRPSTIGSPIWSMPVTPRKKP